METDNVKPLAWADKQWMLNPEWVAKKEKEPKAVKYSFNSKRPILRIANFVPADIVEELHQAIVSSDKAFLQPSVSSEGKVAIDYAYKAQYFLELSDIKDQLSLKARNWLLEMPTLAGASLRRLFYPCAGEPIVTPRATKYIVGGYCALHADSVRLGEDGIWQHKSRPLTTMIYTSGKGQDFEGGVLEFPQIKMIDSNQILQCAPRRGELIAFPGNHWYVHRVTKITSGVRTALIGHFL